MVFIRIIGFIVGCLGFVVLLRLFGLRMISRLTFISFAFSSCMISLISAAPGIINFIAELIFPGQLQYYRILTLLVISVFAIWPVILWERIKVFKNHQLINSLIKKLGLEDFIHRYMEFESFNDILVIIPAFNEEENISGVLIDMPKEIAGKKVDVLVVDDGSTDKTMRVASEAGAYVARNLINMGGGMALQLGFEIATYGRAEIVITMDADGQHIPGEMTHLIEPLLTNSADVVIGSRLRGNREQDSIVRFIGIHFFNRLINFMFGTNISDCSNNYRGMKTEALRKLKLLQEQYHTSELIIEAVKSNLRIKEVPITVLKRKHGTSKKGKHLKYGLNFAKVILKTWWR